MMFASMAERERFRPKVKPKNIRRDIRKMPLSFSFFWHGWTRIFDQGPLGIPKGDACLSKKATRGRAGHCFCPRKFRVFRGHPCLKIFPTPHSAGGGNGKVNFLPLFFAEKCGGFKFISYICGQKHPKTSTMHQLPLTYSMREAAAGLAAGGADGVARQGGGKGLALTPPSIKNLYILHCASCAAAF